MGVEAYEGSQRGGVLTESAAAEPMARGVSEKSIVIDRAYDEYCRLRKQGETPDPDVFCRAFPFQSSLRRLLEADRFFQENPQLLERERSTRWPETGEYFLGFILHRELGRGSFARVFLASEPALGNRRVAVKFAEHGAAEAETLGRLEHANIVSVHSVRKDPVSGLTAVCMPYLGAANLCHLLDRVHKSIPATAAAIQQTIEEARPTGEAKPATCWTKQEAYLDAVARIGSQLADGLASIHAQGICHRDLKPSNVLLADNGRAMLLDFNLSFDAHASEQRLGGTIPYMSPEHLAATDATPSAPDSAVDARSDLFSLGVLLYELLTGEHPFGPVSLKLTAEEVRAQLRLRQTEGPRPLRKINPRVNKALARIVEQCLKADPAQRPQSAAELSVALRATQPILNRARRWIVSHKRAVTAIVVVAIAAAAMGALGSYSVAPPVAVNPDKRSAQEWADEGWEAYEAGRYDDAIKSLKAAVNTDEKNWELAYRLGWAHLRKEDPDSLLKAEKCFGSADEHYAAANPGQLHCGRVMAALGYCYNIAGHQPEAFEAYNVAVQAGYDSAPLQNNLGYSCLYSGSENNEHGKLAEIAFTTAIHRNRELLAAYYNRAVLRASDVANFTRSTGDSPLEDLNMAIHLAQHSSRDTARLYYNAAHIHATAADVQRKKEPRDFILHMEFVGNAQVGAVGDLLGKTGLWLVAQEVAVYHQRKAVEYAERALGRGLDSRVLADDLTIKPFALEIRPPQLTVPLLDINLQMVDLKPEFGK
jgi:serine/threonine protein kinase